jgi:hypothetical protein
MIVYLTCCSPTLDSLASAFFPKLYLTQITCIGFYRFSTCIGAIGLLTRRLPGHALVALTTVGISSDSEPIRWMVSGWLILTDADLL